MSDTPTKRFDNWEQVDCNDCAHYWDSSCDGVSKGSRKACNSFLATRSVVYPQQIKRLQRAVQSLRMACAVNSGVLLVLVIFHLLGWC